MLSAPLTSTFLTGTRAGQTATINQIALSGLISQDHKTLTLATMTPTVEVQTFSNGDVNQRIDRASCFDSNGATRYRTGRGLSGD